MQNEFTPLEFEPYDGWLNKNAFPTHYNDEEHVRSTLQLLFSQIQEYLNSNLLYELSACDEEYDGASFIGSAELFPGDESGTSVADKLRMLYEQILELTNGSIPDGSISADKLAYQSVTAEKLAGGTIDMSKLSTSLSSLISNTAESAADDRYNLLNMLITMDKSRMDLSHMPMKDMFFDSFATVDKLDDNASTCTIDTSAKVLMPKLDETVRPFNSLSSSATLTVSETSPCAFVFKSDTDRFLKGVNIDILASNPIGVIDAVMKIEIRGVGSSNQPTEEVIAQSEAMLYSSAKVYHFTLTSPLALSIDRKYAVVLTLETHTGTTLLIDAAFLSGGMYVQGLNGTVSDTGTTWRVGKLPTSLRFVFGYARPSVYQSMNIMLTLPKKSVSLYLRRTGTISCIPQISAGNSAAFSAMTIDASYTPYQFPDGSVEEKWVYEKSSMFSAARVTLLITETGDGAAVKSLGMIFK